MILLISRIDKFVDVKNQKYVYPQIGLRLDDGNIEDLNY